MAETKQIRPQAGYQEKALSSIADIVIGGGAAGVGKTFTLLLEPLRHLLNNNNFGGVIFRRTSPQIKAEGGLWDTSMSLYSQVGGTPKQSVNEWVFEDGGKMKFSHLEHEKNKLDWQGSQIPFIGFDELTHFTETMFFYLLSRNRSTCGIKPYVRCTCNPDPESWVARLIEWWIDQDSGFPITERNGVVRYFMKDGQKYIWGDTEEEVYIRAKSTIDTAIEKSTKDDFKLSKSDFIKSITFISGSIYENTELLKVNPAYLANLMSQSEAEKASLLEGNWKVRLSDNDVYDYYKFLDIFTNKHAQSGERYITADIALKGSDMFTIWVWEGWRVIGFYYMDKSDGKQVIDKLKEIAYKHKVPQSNITFDADGVGGFIDGWLETSKPFINNSKALQVEGITEEYKNLKTQCYYRSGDKVRNAEIYIPDEIGSIMIGDKTLKQRMIHERKAIKRDKVDSDGKLCIIPKDQMKEIIGHSPDVLDAFMMRALFDIVIPFKTILNKPVLIDKFPDIKHTFGLNLSDINNKSSLIKVGIEENNIYIEQFYCGNTEDHYSIVEGIKDLIVGYEKEKGFIRQLKLKGINVFNNNLKDTEVVSICSLINSYNINLKSDSYNLIDNFSKFSYDVDSNGMLKTVPKDKDNETILPLIAVMKAKGKLW